MSLSPAHDGTAAHTELLLESQCQSLERLHCACALELVVEVQMHALALDVHAEASLPLELSVGH